MAKRGFMDGYKTYDTSKGYGSKSQWQNEFFERLGVEKATEALGPNDPLTLLGLDATATWAMVQKAYRNNAAKYHPDRNSAKDAEEMMKKINAAYEVLEARFSA